MHPSLGPYEESYGEEERAALAGLMAAYPGGLMGVARAVLVLSSKMYGGRCEGKQELTKVCKHGHAWRGCAPTQ